MNNDVEAAAPFLAYRDRIELQDFLAYMRIIEHFQISQTTRRAVWFLALLFTILAIVALSLTNLRGEPFLLLAVSVFFLTWPIHHPRYLGWQYRLIRSLMPESDVTADEH